MAISNPSFFEMKYLNNHFACFKMIFTLSLLLVVVGCSQQNTRENESGSPVSETGLLTLPRLEAIAPADAPLRVIASTSILGDVVAQVGGDAILLTTLIKAGQDPHSYEPGAKALTAVTSAHIIFVNGWNLEETLAENLEIIGENVPIAPVSANITPMRLDEADPEAVEHGGIDPHVWFNIQNVEQWVQNIEQVLSELDPANAETYAQNGADYLVELGELKTYTQRQLDGIPAEKRVLVTNHNSFGYFAEAYDFEILGTVIQGAGSLAEPSAGELTDLIDLMQTHQACTIFTESTLSDSLAQTVAAELTGCDAVQVLPLFSGTIGAAGSGTDSYIGMFRANVDTIVAGSE